MQQRVGTLERRLANLENAYMELLALLVAHGNHHPADLPMAPRRYQQNLRSRPHATETTLRRETTEMAQQLQNHRLRDGGCKGNTSDAAQ